MENTFGKFLKEKRQEKGITQKELAKLLFVSDSAVSKWEKDVAHPDITLLPQLSQILGVTEHELITASIDKLSRIERVQAKKWRAISMSWNLFFYISYGIALFTCFIVNIAVSGTLSWFWIVFSALLLAFTFTNLHQYIKKHRLILVPLSMYLALCLLLGTICLYTNGNWFWIPVISVLFALIIIFAPIFIAKYNVFPWMKKYNDFVSIAIDFVMLNILLLIIDIYTTVNGFASYHWYFSLALPINLLVYVLLNVFLCVRFIKVNRFIKTSIILFIVNIIHFGSSFLSSDNPAIQNEIEGLKFYKADFTNWHGELLLERNIQCIIFLGILGIAVCFLLTGLIVSYCRRKKQITDK